jgi:hypothetical protein
MVEIKFPKSPLFGMVGAVQLRHEPAFRSRVGQARLWVVLAWAYGLMDR